MEDSKTLLFYLLSFAGLITASLLFTGRIEQPEIEAQQPTTGLPTAAKVESTAKPPETEQELCASINRIAFYTPDLSHPEDNHLVISGTVYASDIVQGPIDVVLSVPPPGSEIPLRQQAKMTN